MIDSFMQRMLVCGIYHLRGRCYFGLFLKIFNFKGILCTSY